MVKKEYKCDHCVVNAANLRNKQIEIDKKQIQIEKLQSNLEEQIELTNYWKSKYENWVNTSGMSWDDIESDSCFPEDLQMGKFASYLSNLILKFPLIAVILQFFTTPSHKRKLNSKSTKQSWRDWSMFYRSFIVDVFLRSRSPKSIFRTNLALSAYFVLVKIPKSA
jgi:hypothetical protein